MPAAITTIHTGESFMIGYVTIGTNERAPGARGEGFYAGYFRDLDGNKLNVFYMG